MGGLTSPLEACRLPSAPAFMPAYCSYRVSLLAHFLLRGWQRYRATYHLRRSTHSQLLLRQRRISLHICRRRGGTLAPGTVPAITIPACASRAALRKGRAGLRLR